VARLELERFAVNCAKRVVNKDVAETVPLTNAAQPLSISSGSARSHSIGQIVRPFARSAAIWDSGAPVCGKADMRRSLRPQTVPDRQTNRALPGDDAAGCRVCLKACPSP